MNKGKHNGQQKTSFHPRVGQKEVELKFLS